MNSSQIEIMLPENPIKYLRVYFNISYNLFVSPIQLKYDKSTGLFILVTSKKRKVICGIITFFAVIGEIAKALHGFISDTNQNVKNPLSYFDAFERFAGLINIWTFFTTIWFKLKLFDKIVDILQERRYGLSNLFLLINTGNTWDYKFGTLIVIQLLLGPLSYIWRELNKNNWNIHQTVVNWCKYHYQQYFFESVICNNAVAKNILEPLSGLLGFMFVIVTIPLRSFVDWLPLIPTLLLCDLLTKCEQRFMHLRNAGLLHLHINEVPQKYVTVNFRHEALSPAPVGFWW